MRYLVIIAGSILLFLGVGWGIGAFVLEVVSPEVDNVKLAVALGSIGVGAGVGLVVGIAAAILTAVERRRGK